MEENPNPTLSTSIELPAAQEPRHRSERPTGDSAPVSGDDLSGAGASPEVDSARAASVLESLLLVSGEPLAVEKARQLLGDLTREQFEEVLLRLREKYPAESSGILVERVAKGVQLRTNPVNQEHVRRLFDVKPTRFSRAALETVAIIAYKQPLTRQEIEQIRGVDCAGSLRTLMERRLVRVVGKKDVPGKPFLFGTTREFMEVFGLASLSDLPSMREIEEYLASSTATPVDSGRPGIEIPLPLPFTEGELAAGAGSTGVRLEEALGAPDAEAVPEDDIPRGDDSDAG